jgi:hypothetical protein
MTRLGAAIVGATILAAILGPMLVPFDPSAQQLALRLEGPTSLHWFGLDELGRDIFARVLSGARISLLVGLVVVGVSATVGIVMGSMAGYFGGRVDDAISRLIDVLLAFPGLLLAIAMVAVLGPSLTNVVIALTAIGWVGYARLVRGQVLRARARFRPGGACARRHHAADPGATRHPDDAAGGQRPGDARHGRCDSRGGGAQLPGTGGSAADAKLGNDAELRSRASAGRAAPDDLSGTRDCDSRPRLQFPR